MGLRPNLAESVPMGEEVITAKGFKCQSWETLVLELSYLHRYLRRPGSVQSWQIKTVHQVLGIVLPECGHFLVSWTGRVYYTKADKQWY
jgi:hypothetical protein